MSIDKTGPRVDISEFGARLARETDVSAYSENDTDTIFVHDFVLEIMIGIFPHEYLKPQRVRFNVDVLIARIDHIPADVHDIVSYDHITDGITDIVAKGHILFVEALAQNIADHILRQPRARKVKVRVEKLDIRPGSVGVEIIRFKA